jgi:diguanylate cyclase (GGDEF)-like protein/PAS domain S-box-containing protein
VIDADSLSALLLDMFEFSPVPICISTVGPESRYIKVNDAYLQLVGRGWPELRNQVLVQQGAAIASPGRERRMRLLDEVGRFTLEEATIRHANGHVIPCLISASRTRLNGTVFDAEIIVDITERARMQSEIEYYLRRAAFTDPLTDLPNRAHFDRQLETSLRETAGSDRLTSALAFLDINKFKQVNDPHGHGIGDLVLQHFARRLKAALPPEGFAARLGGDEFAIVYTLDRPHAADLARHLAEELAVICRPFRIEGHHLVVGAACGIAFRDSAQETPSSLLRRADQHMYAAKATGGLVCIHCPAPASSRVPDHVRQAG